MCKEKSGMNEEALEEKEPTLVPKSEIDKRAEELKDRVALPKKPGDKVQFSEMLDWLRIVPDKLLDKIMIYLYRLEPPINRQQVDPQADNNIDVFSGDNLRLLSEEHVVNSHGGGKYMLILSDLTAVGAKTKSSGFKASLMIPTINNPPKLDLREVVWDDPGCKGYKAWARAQKLIDEKNMPVEIEKREVGNSVDGKAMVDMMKVMAEFVTKLNSKDQEELKRRIAGDDSVGKGVMEILLEKMKQDDPNKSVSAIGGIISAMKGLMPDVKGDGGVVALIVPLMQMMMESNKQQTAILIKIIENQQGKGEKEGLSDEDRLLKLIEISKAIKGQNPVEKSTAEMIVEGVTTLAGPALELVNNIMRAKMMATTGMAGVNVTPVQTSAQPANQTKSLTVQPSTTGTTSPPISPAEATTIITQFGPLIIKHLGGEGWEFASLVSEMFGDEVTASAVRHGTEGLLTAAKAVAPFWQQIETTYGEAHLKKWLESFCNYREIIKKMEEEEVKEEKEEEMEVN
jgi:hypothetical protein